MDKLKEQELEGGYDAAVDTLIDELSKPNLEEVIRANMRLNFSTDNQRDITVYF